jgi:hypothetical protein
VTKITNKGRNPQVFRAGNRSVSLAPAGQPGDAAEVDKLDRNIGEVLARNPALDVEGYDGEALREKHRKRTQTQREQTEAPPANSQRAEALKLVDDVENQRIKHFEFVKEAKKLIPEKDWPGDHPKKEELIEALQRVK